MFCSLHINICKSTLDICHNILKFELNCPVKIIYKIIVIVMNIPPFFHPLPLVALFYCNNHILPTTLLPLI